MSTISGVIMLLIGLAVPVLAIVGLVSLFRKPGEENKRKFSDAYFYFMAFVALLILYWGVADLLRLILAKWWVGSATSTSTYYRAVSTYTQEKWLRDLSLRISAILVSLPIWFLHWHKAASKPREEMDESGKKAYSFAVVLVMGLSSIGMLIGAMYLGVNALLGINLSTSEKQSLAYLLPYSLGALALWWSHWKIWHASRAKEMVEVKIEENK